MSKVHEGDVGRPRASSSSSSQYLWLGLGAHRACDRAKGMSGNPPFFSDFIDEPGEHGGAAAAIQQIGLPRHLPLGLLVADGRILGRAGGKTGQPAHAVRGAKSYFHLTVRSENDRKS